MPNQNRLHHDYIRCIITAYNRIKCNDSYIHDCHQRHSREKEIKSEVLVNPYSQSENVPGEFSQNQPLSSSKSNTAAK